MMPSKTTLYSSLSLTKFFYNPLKMIVTFLLFTGLTCTKSADQTQNQIEFEQIYFYEGVIRHIFADFDGDGNMEFVQQTLDKGALLIDFDGPEPKTACHLVGTLELGPYQAFDIIGDPSPEILLPVKRNNCAWVEVVEVIQSYGEIDCKYILKTDSICGIDINNDDKWDGEIIQLQVLDVNNDGQKDILAGISTGFDKNPRAIYAFDGKSGTKLWDYSLAGGPGQIFCADLNDDGKKEIIFGTTAPDNGNTCEDMDDSHSYLICLDKEGHRIWQHEMGGIFTETHYISNDIDDDGTQEIICTFSSGNKANKSTTYKIQIRDGKTGDVIKYFPLPSKFYQPFISDLDRKGKVEIIVGNENGHIYVFNDSLDLIKDVRLGSDLEPYNVSDIVDIKQDGEKEIIASSRNKLVILNNNLEKLGTYQSEMPIHEVHYFKHPYYGELLSLVRTSYSGLRNNIFLNLKYSTAEIDNSMNSEYSIGLLLFIFVSGIITAIFLLTIVPKLIRNIKTAPAQKLSDHRDRLMQTLSVFGHHPTANKNLDRLSFLFKNPPDDEKSLSEYRNRIDNAISTYKNLTHNQIEEIIHKSKSANITSRYIINLQNNLEKLDVIFNDYNKKDISKNQSNIYSEEIPGIVDLIEESIEAIKVELPRYYQSDIFTTIKEVLASFSNDLKAEEIDFKNLILEGDITAKAFIGKTDLTTIFQNLIRNAIDSMKLSPIKELLVKIVATENKIFVEITDTGCGIRQEHLNKIFDREFSTKTDGGFGLYHARTTLNKYGGKIKVANSKPGKGTTMRIEIKKI